MHQSMRKSFGDASEMHWKSVEFDMQGCTLTVFCNLIRDVGVDDGDRYNGVDVFLPGREVELDSSWGDDLHDGEGASPFVVKLLHGGIGGVILEAYVTAGDWLCHMSHQSRCRDTF